MSQHTLSIKDTFFTPIQVQPVIGAFGGGLIGSLIAPQFALIGACLGFVVMLVIVLKEEKANAKAEAKAEIKNEIIGQVTKGLEMELNEILEAPSPTQTTNNDLSHGTSAEIYSQWIDSSHEVTAKKARIGLQEIDRDYRSKAPRGRLLRESHDDKMKEEIDGAAKKLEFQKLIIQEALASIAAGAVSGKLASQEAMKTILAITVANLIGNSDTEQPKK